MEHITFFAVTEIILDTQCSQQILYKPHEWKVIEMSERNVENLV